MFFCLRADLDYVPWDAPDAAEFGHGEPAAILRLLDLARDSGYRLHFFASTRVLNAFPATLGAILEEGHDLDWLCKQPESPHARYAEAKAKAGERGHLLRGLAVEGDWPAGASAPSPDLVFLSARSGATPASLTLFPTYAKSDRDAARAGVGVQRWIEEAKTSLRASASRDQSFTLCVRPQVLARYDPRLGHVREAIDLAAAVGMSIGSLRDALAPAAR